MIDSHDNKGLTQNQDLATKINEKLIANPLPTPRSYEGKKYYGTDDVAKIIGVARRTVSHWHTSTFHDAPIFTADERAHDGRYLYDVERVMQLKAVYRANWTLGSYEPNIKTPAAMDDHQPAQIDEKQRRIDEAENFFNLHFAAVNQTAFSYLWAKQNKKTFFFDVSTADNRHAMAIRAIELNDAGFDVFFGVNLQSTPPKSGRGKEIDITFQTAIICDIDTLGGEHKNTRAKQYPADFETARSFIPFKNSININSGYGLHGYCLFQELIPVNDDTRLAIKTRDKKFIDVIRANAGTFSKVVDGVGDLSRVLRVPGTRNYKCGISDDAPLCHIIEVNDIRFTPKQIDELLNKTIPKPLDTPKQAVPTAQANATDFELFNSPKLTDTERPTDTERALAMLNFIPCSEVTYEDWLQVGMILKNTGNPCSDWELWSRADSRFKQGECEYKWAGFNGGGLTIATLHDLAKLYGYSEKDFQRDWYQQRKGSHRIIHRPEPRTDLSHDDDREDFIWTQNKIKSCPVNLRLPDDFKFNRNGITKIIPAKKETDPPKYVRACRAPIIPTKKFREPIKNTLEYGLAIYSDDEWRNIEVDAAIIGDTRELSKILNRHGGLVDEPKIISQFINSVIALNPEMQHLKSYNQTGWITEDYDDFAFPSADGKAVVRRAGYNYERIFKPKGDPEEWKKKFLEIDEQAGAIGHVIIGGACSAPLIKPLEDLPNLQIHVHGKKSIGKTPILKFAVSIFGDTDVGALTHTFAATPKSRLETACAFSDLPLICEELESIGAKDTEKLSTDIYNYYLGIGGQALKKDGTKRDPKLFSGVRLTSGEHSLVPQNGNGGEFKRVLELRCAKLLDEDFAADLYGFCKRNRGLFGEQWIKYVTDNWQLIDKHYHKVFNFVKETQEKGRENDLTQLRTLIISLVDYQHFKICIGLQSISDADKINAEIVADINAIISTLPTADEIDDTERAIEFLKSFYVANLKNFSHESERPNYDDNDIIQPALECYGKDFRDGEVAFLPHILKRILIQDGGFKSAEKLINEFYDKSYLRHYNGLNTYPTKIKGKTVRAIRFKSGIITTAEKNHNIYAEGA